MIISTLVSRRQHFISVGFFDSGVFPEEELEGLKEVDDYKETASSGIIGHLHTPALTACRKPMQTKQDKMEKEVASKSHL